MIFTVKCFVVCFLLLIISAVFPIWFLITAVIIAIVGFIMVKQKGDNSLQEQAYQEWVDSKRPTE